MTNFDPPTPSLTPDQIRVQHYRDGLTRAQLDGLKRWAYSELEKQCPGDEISEDDIEVKTDELILDQLNGEQVKP